MSDSESETDILSTTFNMGHGKVLAESISKESGERIFKGILSGEVIDKEGDLIPIAEFAKHFETLMKRQTPILLNHKPIHVGQILSLEKTSYNGIPAVLVEAQIFKDFPYDDVTWEGIVKGKYFGMSFTGDIEQTIVKCDANRCHKERKLLAIYELTITDQPANQVSTIMVDYLSKEYNSKNEVKTMTDETPEVATPVPSISKEYLQEQMKGLGDVITSAIEKGFEAIQKSYKEISKEDTTISTPANPEGVEATDETEEEEDETEETDPKEEVSKEVKWIDIQKEYAEDIKTLVQKEIASKTSTISTPTSIPVGERAEPKIRTKLPTFEELKAELLS